MFGWLTAANKDIMKTAGGRFKAMFLTVMFSCVISAPGNELRGFVLQPKGREKPFFEFFDPVKTMRSTTIGGIIMATSLGVGAFSTPFVEAFVSKLREAAKKDALGAIMIALFLLDRLLSRPSNTIEAKAK